MERMQAHKVVFNIQDTMELDFNGRRSRGLGPLNYEAQCGMYLHPTYAISTARKPLGVLDAWMWARAPKDADGTRPGIRESQRWIEGYERVAERARALPQARQVYVADRKADIQGLFLKARDLDYAADYLIRCQHDRALPDGGKLRARIGEMPILGQVCFELPGGRGRKARRVTQRIRAGRIEISDGAKGRLPVRFVLAEEIDPPAGAKPVIWRLLSNRSIDTLAQATERVNWYRARWEIELFFLICHAILFAGGRHVQNIPDHLDQIMPLRWPATRVLSSGKHADQGDFGHLHLLAKIKRSPDFYKVYNGMA